jgi:RNA polymerase sigma-70 factor, ECF subfamily
VEHDRRDRFERLWRECAPAVAAYARRRAAPHAAEDAVAETFLVAWRRLERVPAEPLPWLYGVARRSLANQRRGQARRQALGARLEHELELPAVEEPRDLRLLDALATLRDRDRELLLLVAWEGLTPTEAAVALGSTPVACRVRLHRARRRLAAALDPAPQHVETTPKEAA